MKKNAKSARYEGILLIPARDADFCQELLDMPCDERHNPVEYTGIGKYADVRSFGLTFPNGYSVNINVWQNRILSFPNRMRYCSNRTLF